MGEVVQVEARDREHPQVGVRALVVLDPLLEQRVAGLERPRHEGGEAAVLVLELADRVEVVEDVLGLLDVAVHHGRGGLEALAVRLAVHVEPRARARPSWARCACAPARTAPRRRRPGCSSAPPALSRASTSGTGLPATSAIVRISEAVKKCGVTDGKRRRVSRTSVEVVVERQGRVVAALQQHGGRALARPRTRPWPAPRPP